MRSSIVFILCLAVVAAACGRPSDHRNYTLQGQVLSLEIPRRQLTIKHEEIKGLMPAMTMPYTVKDEKLLVGLAQVDVINATLVIASNEAYLTTIRKVGEAPLEKPPAETTVAPRASSGFELLKPGEQVPSGAFSVSLYGDGVCAAQPPTSFSFGIR